MEYRIPEAVALRLMDLIADAEGRTYNSNVGGKAVDREWILKTYGQCAQTVAHPHRVNEFLKP